MTIQWRGIGKPYGRNALFLRFVPFYDTKASQAASQSRVAPLTFNTKAMSLKSFISIATSLFLCSCTVGTVPAIAQHAPTLKDQKRIYFDHYVRHNGDAPQSPGPLATNLSPALNRRDIAVAMSKVANWEIERAKPYFGRIWTWSVLYTGIMAAGQSLHQERYIEAMDQVGGKYHWELSSDSPIADDQSIGQMYAEMYMLKHDPVMIAGTRSALNNLIANEDHAPARLPWWWCDSLFMAPPVWARMYAITGDQKYLQYIDREWWKTSRLLYDNHEHLYFRDASYLTAREPNGEKMFWSRGNGWVLAGLAQTLQFMPKSDPYYQRYVVQFQQMASKIASIQSPDGLWRAGLLDPSYYVRPETSGSALFVYALAWGIHHHLLSRQKYLPVVARGWAGLTEHIYASGRLGDVQQSGAAPAFYPASSSYNYGVGAFLLAGAELRQISH